MQKGIPIPGTEHRIPFPTLLPGNLCSDCGRTVETRAVVLPEKDACETATCPYCRTVWRREGEKWAIAKCYGWGLL
jgi:hypothetical protein